MIAEFKSCRIWAAPCLIVLLWVSLLPVAASAAPSAQQRQQNRLQEQRQQKLQQRFQDMHLPSANPVLEQSSTQATSPGPCFNIQHIYLDTLNEARQPFGRALTHWRRRHEDRCYSLSGIKQLQADLFNWLTARGYVTSRVLLPEQDISQGDLRLLLVPGRLEGMQAEGLPARLLHMALPAQAGGLVNLRDMEQAMENFARLPGLDAHLSLAPGTRQGQSLLLAKASWPRHTAANVLLNSNYYGHHTYADAQANVVIGSPFGLLDRLALSANTNLNQQSSDMALGASLGYDLAWGNWLLSTGYSQQIYENWVEGILENFLASGDTRTGRLSLGRMLYRSQTLRVSFSLLGNYADVGNYLDESTIRVSSYWLRKYGASIDIKRQWAGGEWQASLSGEQGYASGTAVWAGVAPQDFRIWHIYARASRALRKLPLLMSVQLNGQYAPEPLLSNERYSLTASTAVPGFDNDYVSADSALSSEWKLSGRPSGVPFAPSAFVAVNAGVSKGDDYLSSVRLVSSSIGASFHYSQASMSLRVSAPLAQLSSIDPSSHYTLSGSLYWQY